MSTENTASQYSTAADLDRNSTGVGAATPPRPGPEGERAAFSADFIHACASLRHFRIQLKSGGKYYTG